MIIRTSANLNKKIHVTPEHVLPRHRNPYADWSARLFTAGRAQFILIANTVSLYSVLIPGRGITSAAVFTEKAVSAIREQLFGDNMAFIFERLIAPEAADVSFSRALNHSVTGSLNNLVEYAQFSLVGRELSLLHAGKMLARYPMGALRYGFPVEVFSSMTVDES